MVTYNQPLSGNLMPRAGGFSTMMRLPISETSSDLDACFVGIPMDHGTSFRSGTRMGPKAIREQSHLMRPFNMATGAAPFARMQVADIGDIAINPYNLPASLAIIAESYAEIINNGCIPLTLGGDHSITYPILQAMQQKYGKVALVHVDAHADINDEMFGEKYAHGTTFRRAFDEGLLDNDLVWQIGLRGTGYAPDDFDWSREQGWQVIPAEDIWYQSVKPLMAEILAKLGDHPVYLSFDIDSLDPAYAPGTGTPECGGLTTSQALEIIRGLQGARLVGADLVEVSPPYDITGNTAMLGANLLYEMLCVLP